MYLGGSRAKNGLVMGRGSSWEEQNHTGNVLFVRSDSNESSGGMALMIFSE